MGNRIKREATLAKNVVADNNELLKPLCEPPVYKWNVATSYSSRIGTPHIIYQTPPDPYRTLDTSQAVGCIEGIADVSSTGAATYQIPIKVIDGTNKCNLRYP